MYLVNFLTDLLNKAKAWLTGIFNSIPIESTDLNYSPIPKSIAPYPELKRNFFPSLPSKYNLAKIGIKSKIK